MSDEQGINQKQTIPDSAGVHKVPLSESHYPAHYAAVKAAIERIQADYPNDTIPRIMIEHDERSIAQYIETFGRLMTGAHIPAILNKQADNGAYLGIDRFEAIAIDSAMADRMTPAEMAALAAHEAGHDMMNHTTQRLVMLVSPVETQNEHSRIRECQADHLAARYTSPADTVAMLTRLVGRLSPAGERLTPLTTHPYPSVRVEALKALSAEVLAARSENIQFNDDCSVAAILTPITLPVLPEGLLPKRY